MKHQLVIGLYCLLLVFLCGKLPMIAAADVTTGKTRLNIVATTFPMHQLAMRIVQGQQGISLVRLLPAQAGCPHDYALTPQEMRTLSGADIVLINGLGLEEFLGESLDKANPHAQILDAAQGIENILPSHVTEYQNDNHKSNANPHLFASPRMMARMAITLAQKLALIYPEGAEQFMANAQAYAVELTVLADSFAAVGKRIKNPRIVTQHDTFAYLAKDAGLEVVAVVQAHAGQEPAAADILRLTRIIRTQQAAALFTEPQYPDKTERILAAETGLPLAELDPVATGPENAPADYYTTIMRNNLAVLEKTLGAH